MAVDTKISSNCKEWVVGQEGESHDYFDKFIRDPSSETIITWESSLSERNYIAEQIFDLRNVVLNEDWANVENIPSRIVRVTELAVICECILDSEQRVYEMYSFSLGLFDHLHPLDHHKLIMIKISTKPGSSRIDIFDGKGIVDSRLFDLHDEWLDLMDSELDKPFNL